MSASAPLAHSAPNADRAPHLYGDHVRGVVAGARVNAEELARHMADAEKAARLGAAVADAGAYHDLGKLDTDNQAALRQGRRGRMPWDHVDAGVAHLMRCGARGAAWIVRAHHAPGLPARAAEFNRDVPDARQLRGGRRGDREGDAADDLTARTDSTLQKLLAAHVGEAGKHLPRRAKAEHGLLMRMALSCLVDGDHSDAAGYEHGWRPPAAAAPRWEERLARLDVHVAALSRGGSRQADRDAFYQACRQGPTGAPMVACEGPVGIGKTTAVAAWCLRRAIVSGARRLFVVAPYTTILSQTAKVLREALLLPDEAGREDEVVAEHHHRADFQALASRDLAVLWRAPIVVTTSVQFFETLAACEPARLRKLHALPGAVVFVDEAHAALAASLWRRNWAWMRELSRDFGCSFVFASGSLARVWDEADLVDEEDVTRLPDIAPPALAARLNAAERSRVRYRTLGRVTDVVTVIRDAPGPRPAVFNTIQTAAVVADRLRKAGVDVLHLSTALCPSDRERILQEVRRRLGRGSAYGSDWVLVATSLVEAGVDLSFRTGLRERFSTSSLIQIGGRVNRHGGDKPGEVIDFQLDADEDMTTHPGAVQSAKVLGRFWRDGVFGDAFSPAHIVSQALREEVRDDHGRTGVALAEAEAALDYPQVAKLGRLIDADMSLVVVDEALKRRLARRDTVGARDLLAGSVQIWTTKTDTFALNLVRERPGVYAWPHRYEPDFLGYMAGALELQSGAAFVV